MDEKRKKVRSWLLELNIDKIEQIISRLKNPLHKKLMELKFIDFQDYEFIADSVNLSEIAVKKHFAKIYDKVYKLYF